MSRERDRIAKKMEKNPVVECNKIQKKFYPELFKKFEQVTDPRNKSYIEYSTREMLGTVYYKGIAGISSMQEMTRAFNDENVVKNLYGFMGSSPKKYLPHGVTENDFLEKLERIIPWTEFIKLIKPYYYKGERGNKPFPLERMLRIYVIQNLYDLADMAAKNEIIDSRSYHIQWELLELSHPSFRRFYILVCRFCHRPRDVDDEIHELSLKHRQQNLHRSAFKCFCDTRCCKLTVSTGIGHYCGHAFYH